MNSYLSICVLVLGALLLSWFALRVKKPELEKKLRTGFVAAASSVAGIAVAIVTLGMVRPSRKSEESKTNSELELETHDTTREKYATDDHFEELRDGADDLEPAPSGNSLSDELEDFRAGSDELLE